MKSVTHEVVYDGNPQMTVAISGAHSPATSSRFGDAGVTVTLRSAVFAQATELWTSLQSNLATLTLTDPPVIQNSSNRPGSTPHRADRVTDGARRRLVTCQFDSRISGNGHRKSTAGSNCITDDKSRNAVPYTTRRLVGPVVEEERTLASLIDSPQAGSP